MVSRRAPTLCLWLAAILVMALGMLVPNVASAHAGHDAHAGRAGDWVAAVPEGSTALLTLENFEGLPEIISVTGSIAASRGESASIPCGGAACCNTGHGCCAAIPVASPASPHMPLASEPETGLSGLLPGVAAAALPEPPRPFR